MFDNLGTALVQALGFFAVFGFFVYQTLFADSKPKNSKLNPKKTKISETKESIKKEPKKGLFNRKSKSVEENAPVQKKGIFGRKKEVVKEEIKPKKKETSKNQLNKILNKYPYLPFILGFSLLAILIIDLVNYYK